MSGEWELKDSGQHREFETGAKRDRPTGKGRFDLISPRALRRLAIVLEKGAAKYAPRNWEKGMPLCVFLDSALRHLHAYLGGARDEDHLGCAMFNVMALIHTEELINEDKLPASLNDLPLDGVLIDHEPPSTEKRLIDDTFGGRYG